MRDTQLCRQTVILFGFVRIPKIFIRTPQTQIQRGEKFADPIIIDRIGMLKSGLIPAECILRTVLKAGNIMRGDAGFIIVSMRLPGLLIQPAGIFKAALEFGARALKAELDDGVSCIHS